MKNLQRLRHNWHQEPIGTYALLVVTIGISVLSFFTQQQLLIRFAMSPTAIVRLHEYWRLITPIFLHADWLHLAVNMVTLYFFGSQIERIFGSARYLAIYFGSGLLGNLFSFAVNSSAPYFISIGASSALFGLFGAFFLLGVKFKQAANLQAFVRQYGLFILLNFGFNLFSTRIDLFAHLGGLIGGFLLASVVGLKRGKLEIPWVERLLTGCLFLVLVAFCYFRGF